MQLSGDSTPSSVRSTSSLPMIVSDFSSSARSSKAFCILCFITLHPPGFTKDVQAHEVADGSVWRKARTG